MLLQTKKSGQVAFLRRLGSDGNPIIEVELYNNYMH